LVSFSGLDSSGKTQAVLAYALALADQNQKNAVAQMLKGDALARAGRHEEALVSLDEAVRLDGRSVLIRDVRGVVRALAGKTEDAMADFERMTELEPKYASAYANRGLVQLAAGSVPAAVESLTQALELAPNFALAYNSRGVAYASMEAWEEADNDFNKAAELSPGLPYALSNARFVTWTRGQIAFRQGLLDVGDGRGSTLIAQSYERRTVDIADGKTIDVFVIKATPQTNTLA